MTFNEILAKAGIIKEETGINLNSNTRIGQMFIDVINFFKSDTAAGKALTAAEAANAATEAAPKTITLLAMISISTLPDALGYADGSKIYSSFYNLVHTRILNEGTGTPEWSAGEAPRLIDSFIFESKEYKFLNNDMRPSGRGVVSNLRTSGNGAAGTTDTYTITYSDGTTSSYTVTNGANGTGATLEQVRSQSTGNVPSSKLLDDELAKTGIVDKAIEEDAYLIVDPQGRVIAKIDANGVNSRKYNICNSTGQVVGLIDAEILASLIESSAKVDGFQEILNALSTDVNYYSGFYVVDQRPGKPYIGLKYDDNGLDAAMVSDHFKSLINTSVPSAAVVKINGQYNADINMCVIYGQSLAIGGATMTEDFYTALQFQLGVLISANTSTSLANMNSEAYREPLYGNIVQMGNGSGLNGRIITKKWNELLIDENGKTLQDFNYNLMGFVAGVSGGQWYQLAKYNYTRTVKYVNDAINGFLPTAIQFGANYEGYSYLNLVQGVYFAYKKAIEQGKTFNVPVLCWVQGEASSDKADTIATYESKLLQIFGDLNSDIKAITGQENDVEFIIYQNSSFAIYQVPTSPSYISGGYFEGVPLACLKVAREQHNVRFGCPLYPYSPSQASSDKIHLSNAGYALMSSHFAVQAKRAITDKAGKSIFYPNQILTSQNGANYYVRVKFDVPVKPLVIDITGDDGLNMRGHGLQQNYGFSILNALSAEIVSSVRLSGEDTVVLTCTQNPAGLSLTYALTGVFGGGNLRDSQGDTIKTTFNNVEYRVDNWCPFFRLQL